ncbi:MAG: alanine--glyoxylate aminotransferase family protein [Planctomycetes bacterium]|nr:alanine--glyoxylate aminotransferase family protein [Planctomycetota bacterium]
MSEFAPPPPTRILMGPGPTNVAPRVLRAMSAPTIGHRDPAYFQACDELVEHLRALFRTKNELTLALPATGMGSMECCVANLIEPGDGMIIGNNGVFSTRMADLAERYGAKVRLLKKPWGEVFSPAEIEGALKEAPAKVVAVVHGETSTGAMQPQMKQIADIAHKHGALLLADTVSSIAGAPFEMDAWGVDAVYTGGQKCLAAPPGIGCISFSPRADEALKNRKSKVTSWYFDLTMIRNCWNKNRFYHHTGPVNMTWALLEGLRMVREEGLDARIARHGKAAAALYAGVEAMGLALHVKDPATRLPTLTTVCVPEGIDEAKVRGMLLERHDLEFGAGMGELQGKVWRIGLMGENARSNNVYLALSTLGAALKELGAKVNIGAGIEAAAAKLK